MGVLINVLALWGLEAYRTRKQKAQTDEDWERQKEQAREAWERERAARLEELRRETYTEVVAACESRAFLETTPDDQQPEVVSRWRSARAMVRFVTDDRALIEAADALIDASVDRKRNPAGFTDTRTAFVAVCRSELGRAALDIKSKQRPA